MDIKSEKKDKIDLLVFADESELDSSTVMICSLAIEKKLFLNIISILEKKYGAIYKLPEIHFKKYSKADYIKRNLANEYVDLFNKIISDKKLKQNIFLNIVICDKTKLSNDFGNGSNRNTNIEKCFTRLALTYAINRFSYKYKKIIVDKIVVDAGGKTDDSYFKKAGIEKIITKSKAICPKVIDFIDSNPKKETKINSKYSVFVDITDFILGATRNCCIVDKATNKYKKQITEKIFHDILMKMRTRTVWGKINTYPRLRHIDEYKEKIISGDIIYKKKYHYSENPELQKKFCITPYNQIGTWDDDGK